MLIDREVIERKVVLNELDQRIQLLVSPPLNQTRSASAQAVELDSFRRWLLSVPAIESLPPPAEVSGLVRRARAYAHDLLDDSPSELCAELADALEAQEKKLAVMREALMKIGARLHPQDTSPMSWEAQIARKALEDLK